MPILILLRPGLGHLRAHLCLHQPHRPSGSPGEMAGGPVRSSASSALGNRLRDQSSPSRGQCGALQSFFFNRYLHVGCRKRKPHNKTTRPYLLILLCREFPLSFLVITIVCVECRSLRRADRRESTWPTCALWAPTP